MRGGRRRGGGKERRESSTLCGFEWSGGELLMLMCGEVKKDLSGLHSVDLGCGIGKSC